MHTHISASLHHQSATGGSHGKIHSQPAYFLSEHSHCCELEDGAIILDLRSGSYLGVDAEYLPDLRVRIPNWPNSPPLDRGTTGTKCVPSEIVIAGLLARGILTNSPISKGPLTIPAPLSALTIEAATAAQRRVPIMYLLRFVIALLAVVVRHRDNKLESLLGWLRQRQFAIRRDGHFVTPNEAVKQLDSFLRLRVWFYTAAQRCLFDSLVLAVFLTKKNIPCTFVIGVSTKPFLAHAWLQIGELILNDTAEHVQMFKAILAIGESG